jgi:hypothetical protein
MRDSNGLGKVFVSTTVLLKDLVDALEMQLEESSSFLDLEAGQIEIVSHDLLDYARESPDTEPSLPDWQKPEWEMAKRIVTADGFLKLPDKFDFHEWAIMRDFSHSVTSDRIRGELLKAIHGAGAFRHFKAVLRRYRMESAWFTFRTAALKQIALDWCQENHISFR